MSKLKKESLEKSKEITGVKLFLELSKKLKGKASLPKGKTVLSLLGRK
jgi:hypothetical protein